MPWLSQNYYLTKLKKSELPEMLTFYIIEIYEHFHFTDYTPKFYESQLEYLLEEDTISFENSVYYILRDYKKHKIYGSVKTSYWDTKTTLPIEKLFGIPRSALLLPNIKNLWHIGRFVISRYIPEDRISILKKILFNAFYPVHALERGLIIAECDKKVMITLEKMGIESFVLGKSIEYICSETLPIYIKSEWLNSFMALNTDRYYSSDNIRDSNFFSKLIKSKTKAAFSKDSLSGYKILKNTFN